MKEKKNELLEQLKKMNKDLSEAIKYLDLKWKRIQKKKYFRK